MLSIQITSAQDDRPCTWQGWTLLFMSSRLISYLDSHTMFTLAPAVLWPGSEGYKFTQWCTPSLPRLATWKAPFEEDDDACSIKYLKEVKLCCCSHCPSRSSHRISSTAVKATEGVNGSRALLQR